MPIIDAVRAILPPQYREMAKFLVVGGTAWIVDTGLFTLMSHTILENKILTAKVISILVSTVVSYVLNREWSFSNRGGRERHHEAALFFVVNGLALALNLIPLALSRYVFGFTVGEHSRFAVSVADFISANVIGTLIGMAFRYWAYRRFVFPEDFSEDEAAGPADEKTPEVPAGPVAGRAAAGRGGTADSAAGEAPELPLGTAVPVAPPAGSDRGDAVAPPGEAAVLPRSGA